MQENSKHKDSCLFAKIFVCAEPQTRRFFCLCTFFENTNTQILLFPVFTNTNTKIFGFAKQHEQQDYFARRIDKMNIFFLQGNTNTKKILL